jgi:glycosyltransferase involved in cell wall biosynthesis
VLAVPSHFEPFGLVVLEAASTGVPVVVTPGVGAAPLVADHEAGVVWGSDEPLAEALARLAALPGGGRTGAAALAAALAVDRIEADWLRVLG